MRTMFATPTCPVLGLAVLLTGTASAQGPGPASVPGRSGGGECEEAARILSDAALPVVGAGILNLGLLEGRRGRKRADRAVLAQVANFGITRLLKTVVREERPDRTGVDSFPSGHTSTSFAFADVLADQDGDNAVWYYLGAALVGWSRVELDRHHWHDVAAGAAVGIAASRLTADLSWEVFRRLDSRPSSRDGSPLAARGRRRAWLSLLQGGRWRVGEAEISVGLEFDGSRATLVRAHW